MILFVSILLYTFGHLKWDKIPLKYAQSLGFSYLMYILFIAIR
jgi:hypothetical protein